MLWDWDLEQFSAVADRGMLRKLYLQNVSSFPSAFYAVDSPGLPFCLPCLSPRSDKRNGVAQKDAGTLFIS